MMAGEGLLLFECIHCCQFPCRCIYVQFLLPPSGGATGTKHEPEACRLERREEAVGEEEQLESTQHVTDGEARRQAT